MKEQTSAPPGRREPGSRACGCLLRATWHGAALIHEAVHATSLPSSGGLAASQMLTRTSLLGVRCPQNCALGTIWKSVNWPGQTHARACSKLNIVDDSMPVLSTMPWSDLVYQKNFIEKRVTRGSTGAGKLNLNSLCVTIQVWHTCLYG